MVKLKNKIKTINSLPNETKKKTSIIKILIIIITILIIGLIIFVIYTKLIPYIFATNINNITGKKINITDCNTKDYVIINKDKSYTMSLTNEDCIKKHYEGDITIKYNEVYFNKNIKGYIDNNNNIIIKNKIFEEEKNE